jgi:hypothetical protein
VSGETASTDFPTTPGAYDRTLSGRTDAFAAKLSADGSALLWSTFLGGSGSGEDEPWAVTVDGYGNPVVAGVTYCPDFPTTAGAYDVTFSGGFTDAFVAKLSANGSALVWSTFLGGGNGDGDQALAIAEDASGDLVVAGRTLSTDFPVTSGAYDGTYNGDGDAFVAKLSADGSALDWATFLGGSHDEAVGDFALDSSQDLVLTGATGSIDFPVTSGAYDGTFNGFVDAFVAKLSADGSVLIWSSFLGGANADTAEGLALDAVGRAVVAGYSDSADFPVTAGAYDSTFNGSRETFVAKVSLSSGLGNQAPEILSFDAGLSKEGGLTVFTATATDPDGDLLTYSFDFQNDGTWDQVGASNTATYTWGDDSLAVARVKVSDGTLSAETTTSVTVANVAPTILGSIQAFVVADIGLRVAGEKWHDVRLDLLDDGGLAGSVGVVRTPGSPDDQVAALPAVEVPLSRPFQVSLSYTPEDDPLNGQPNGATPTWVIFRFPDGTDTRVKHTFNVVHPETWTWTIDDVRPYLLGRAVSFAVTAYDVGSDDLTFDWDFGDGSTATVTYFNDGVGRDPWPSPDVNPITSTDVATHAHQGGTYLVTVTIIDDDGGTAVETLVLRVGG